MAQKFLPQLDLLCWVGRADGSPAQVIIIRYADKPDEGNHLSLKGRTRAAGLVPHIQGRSEVSKHKTSVAIYAQGAKNEHFSRPPNVIGELQPA